MNERKKELKEGKFNTRENMNNECVKKYYGWCLITGHIENLTDKLIKRKGKRKTNPRTAQVISGLFPECFKQSKKSPSIE